VLDRLGVLRDLDDDVDFLGRVASGIDLVEAHLWLRCECGWWKPAILRPAVLQCTKRRGRRPPTGRRGGTWWQGGAWRHGRRGQPGARTGRCVTWSALCAQPGRGRN